MDYGPTCLLCCESLHSPLIPGTDEEEFQELSEIFDIFCYYMKLDSDVSVKEEYRGKLFPFCCTCSFQVHRLVEYHQEKIKARQALTQMVASMATLVLEKRTEDRTKYFKPSISSSAAHENWLLTEQIRTLRKKIIGNYSPRVALTNIQPKEVPRVAVNTNCNVFNDEPRRNIRALSPDICQEIWKTKIPDEENYFEFDHMDVDVKIEVSDNDDKSHHSAEEADEPVVFVRKSGRPSQPNSLSKERTDGFISNDGKRVKSYHQQIGENTFCIENHIYTFEDGVFKCSDCPQIEKLQKKMNRHILQSHVHSIPVLPEKSLEDFRIGENKYVLANKFVFEKDTRENVFKCSRCEYTSVLWSAMYNHIFKMHYRSDFSKTSTRTFVPKRPKGEVKKLSENEYEYIGIKFLVLPNGTHKCGLCGSLRSNASHMKAHIRSGHVDCMPELPDQSPEHYEIATDLFCLSRKFIFEKTGDHFTCSHGECYAVRSTWDDMYAHVREDHWSAEYTPYSEQNLGYRPRTKRSNTEAGVITKKESVQEFQIASNDADLNSSDSVAPLDHEPSGNAIKRSRRLPRKSQVPKRQKKMNRNGGDSGIGLTPLAAFETSPGHYAFKGFEFRFTDDVFYCCSCPYTCKVKSSLFRHIQGKHIQSCDGFVQVSPNEFLYLDKYPGAKEPDGRFSCRVEGCEFVTSVSVMGHLRTHIIQNHYAIDNPPPASSVDESGLQKKLEQLRLQLSKYETGPGEYKYRGFDFHLVENQFECDSCSYRCSRETGTIFNHVSEKHVDSSQKRQVTKEKMSLVEVRPGEFVFGGRFKAFRQLDGKFRCGVGDCKSVLSKRSGICSHLHLTHMDNPVVCEMCGKVYQNSSTLRIHMARVHAEVKEQKCPTCDKSYYSKLAFAQHLRTAHKQRGRKFQCEQCGKAYVNASTLQDHIASVHMAIVPDFHCPQCGKIYHSGGGLSSHLKADHAHAGKKIYPCPICGKEFKYKESIRRHVLVVHEGKKSSDVYKRSQRAGPSTSMASGKGRELISLPEPEVKEEAAEESDEEDDEEQILSLRQFMNL